LSVRVPGVTLNFQPHILEALLKSRKWLALAVAVTFVIWGGAVFAGQGNHDHEDRDRGDHGHGNHGDHDNGHWRDKHKDHDDDDDRRGYGFAEHDRDSMRGWYAEHQRRLPPGLAKRDRLPPGLESQLVIHAVLPPMLETHIVYVPVDLERQLPPPPTDCERVVVGGHIVLMNRRTKIVLDIFHFE